MIESIIISDDSAGRKFSFEVQKYNPYHNLEYKVKTKELNGRKVDQLYELSESDKIHILKKFYGNRSLSEAAMDYLTISHADVRTYFSAFDNSGVISYMLQLYGNNSITGILSQLIVINENGKVISNLPESNNGYFSPVVTNDRKYLACIVGEALSHGGELIGLPEFKVLEVRTGREIFQIPNSSEYGFLSTTVFDNFFVQVLMTKQGTYDYCIIFPERKVYYKRNYTASEIGNFISIDQNGILLKDAGGRDGYDLYDRDFEKCTF